MWPYGTMVGYRLHCTSQGHCRRACCEWVPVAVPFHNEVWAGLLYSAQEAGATATAYVLRSSTWHMEKVIASW